MPTKLEGFVAKYRQDHTHPVNHFLHVGVGWPMCAAALILLPFRPLWSLGLFLGLVSPVLTVSGFVWGLWSASNIKSPGAGLAAAPVSDAVLVPVKLESRSDAASRDSMEDAIRAIIVLGGGE